MTASRIKPPWRLAAVWLLLACSGTLTQTLAQTLAQTDTQPAARQPSLEQLQAAQADAPASAQAAGRLGMYFHAHEQYAQALDWYQRAQKLAPNEWRWNYLTGLALTESTQIAPALAPLREAYALAPAQEAVILTLARNLATLGQLGEAGELLERGAESLPDSAPLLAELGIIRLQQGQMLEAATRLRAALALQPAANRLYVPLASALRGAGDREGATKALQQVGSVAPRVLDPVGDAMRSMSRSFAFYMSQGLLAASSGDWPAARQLLQRAVAENPADPNAGVNLARVLEAGGDIPGARKELKRVLGSNPTHPEAWFNLGVLAELEGDDSQAMDHYQNSLAFNPDDFRTHLLTANAALRLSQMSVAAHHFGKASALKPERDELLIKRAVAQWADNCSAAINSALSLVRRRPEDPAALSLYIRLASTCDQAPETARVNALNAARNLHQLQPDPLAQINLAMAEAASGYFKRAAEVHQAAMATLSGRVSAEQRRALTRVHEQYLDGRASDQPFVLNEQILSPPRLTAADRR